MKICGLTIEVSTLHIYNWPSSPVYEVTFILYSLQIGYTAQHRRSENPDSLNYSLFQCHPASRSKSWILTHYTSNIKRSLPSYLMARLLGVVLYLMRPGGLYIGCPLIYSYLYNVYFPISLEMSVWCVIWVCVYWVIFFPHDVVFIVAMAVAMKSENKSKKIST